jgi:hypothetical protein
MKLGRVRKTGNPKMELGCGLTGHCLLFSRCKDVSDLQKNLMPFIVEQSSQVASAAENVRGKPSEFSVRWACAHAEI